MSIDSRVLSVVWMGVTTATSSAALLRSGTSIKSSDPTIEKVVKVAQIVLAVQLVASFPTVAAIEWSSPGDARQYFETGNCPREPQNTLAAARDCLHEGRPFAECSALINITGKFLVSDHLVFTRHNSGAVSIVRTDAQGTRACFILAAHPEARVAQTCVTNLPSVGGYTYNEMHGTGLVRMATDLHPSLCVRHIAVHSYLPGVMPFAIVPGCGAFHEQPANTHPGNAPACIVTLFGRGGPVMQACFNPSDPTAVNVRTIPAFTRVIAPDPNQVFSIVTKDPVALGLKP